MSVRVDARVDMAEARLSWAYAVPMFQDLVSVDLDPPSSGREIELRFRFPDDTPDRVAEQLVRERLRMYSMDPLALRVRRD